jgi:CheY-like chemotaxis protein
MPPAAEYRTSGESGLAAVQASPAGAYDVILLDICMPHMDGYQVAEHIRYRTYRTSDPAM